MRFVARSAANASPPGQLPASWRLPPPWRLPTSQHVRMGAHETDRPRSLGLAHNSHHKTLRIKSTECVVVTAPPLNSSRPGSVRRPSGARAAPERRARGTLATPLPANQRHSSGLPTDLERSPSGAQRRTHNTRPTTDRHDRPGATQRNASNRQLEHPTWMRRHQRWLALSSSACGRRSQECGARATNLRRPSCNETPTRIVPYRSRLGRIACAMHTLRWPDARRRAHVIDCPCEMSRFAQAEA